jgi:hypothetical protein
LCSDFFFGHDTISIRIRLLKGLGVHPKAADAGGLSELVIRIEIDEGLEKPAVEAVGVPIPQDLVVEAEEKPVLFESVPAGASGTQPILQEQPVVENLQGSTEEPLIQMEEEEEIPTEPITLEEEEEDVIDTYREKFTDSLRKNHLVKFHPESHQHCL